MCSAPEVCKSKKYLKNICHVWQWDSRTLAKCNQQAVNNRHKLCTWVCPTRYCSWVLFLLFGPISLRWLYIARALALGAQLPVTMTWWLLPTVIIYCLPIAMVPPVIWTSPPFGWEWLLHLSKAKQQILTKCLILIYYCTQLHYFIVLHSALNK